MMNGSSKSPNPRTSPPNNVLTLLGSLKVVFVTALTRPRCSGGNMLIEKESIRGPDMFMSPVRMI